MSRILLESQEFCRILGGIRGSIGNSRYIIVEYQEHRGNSMESWKLLESLGSFGTLLEVLWPLWGSWSLLDTPRYSGVLLGCLRASRSFVDLHRDSRLYLKPPRNSNSFLEPPKPPVYSRRFPDNPEDS